MTISQDRNKEVVLAKYPDARLYGGRHGKVWVQAGGVQVAVEGWTPEHDDEHDDHEISKAARCYIRHAEQPERRWPKGIAPFVWPRDSGWWKPSPDPVRNLVKAGALIAAEIDRLQRAHGPQTANSANAEASGYPRY